MGSTDNRINKFVSAKCRERRCAGGLWKGYDLLWWASRNFLRSYRSHQSVYLELPSLFDFVFSFQLSNVLLLFIFRTLFPFVSFTMILLEGKTGNKMVYSWLGISATDDILHGPLKGYLFKRSLLLLSLGPPIIWLRTRESTSSAKLCFQRDEHEQDVAQQNHSVFLKLCAKTFTHQSTKRGV